MDVQDLSASVAATWPHYLHLLLVLLRDLSTGLSYLLLWFPLRCSSTRSYGVLRARLRLHAVQGQPPHGHSSYPTNSPLLITPHIFSLNKALQFHSGIWRLQLHHMARTKHTCRWVVFPMRDFLCFELDVRNSPYCIQCHSGLWNLQFGNVGYGALVWFWLKLFKAGWVIIGMLRLEISLLWFFSLMDVEGPGFTCKILGFQGGTVHHSLNNCKSSKNGVSSSSVSFPLVQCSCENSMWLRFRDGVVTFSSRVAHEEVARIPSAKFCTFNFVSFLLKFCL